MKQVNRSFQLPDLTLPGSPIGGFIRIGNDGYFAIKDGAWYPCDPDGKIISDIPHEFKYELRATER